MFFHVIGNLAGFLWQNKVRPRTLF